jgi:hypothetical protein
MAGNEGSGQGNLLLQDPEHRYGHDEQDGLCIQGRVQTFLGTLETDPLHIEPEEVGCGLIELLDVRGRLPQGLAHPNILGSLTGK